MSVADPSWQDSKSNDVVCRPLPSSLAVRRRHSLPSILRPTTANPAEFVFSNKVIYYLVSDDSLKTMVKMMPWHHISEVSLHRGSTKPFSTSLELRNPPRRSSAPSPPFCKHHRGLRSGYTETSRSTRPVALILVACEKRKRDYGALRFNTPLQPNPGEVVASFAKCPSPCMSHVLPRVPGEITNRSGKPPLLPTPQGV